MKKIYFLSLLLMLSFAECKKAKFDYIARVEVEPIFTKSRILVITNRDGDIVGEFEVPADSRYISNTLVLDDDEANAVLDYHLIDTSRYLGFNAINTFMGAISGEWTSMNNVLQNNIVPLDRFLVAVIRNAPNLEVIQIPSIGSNLDTCAECGFGREFDLVNNTVTFLCSQSESILIRCKPVGSMDFRALFYDTRSLPANVDSFFVDWNDFQAEKTMSVAAPNGRNLNYLSVNALTQDGLSTTNIYKDICLSNAFFTNSRNVQLPANWPIDEHPYRVLAKYGSWRVDKVFEAGEPIVFSIPDLSIGAMGFDNFKLYADVLGNDVDLSSVILNIIQPQPNSQFSYIIGRIHLDGRQDLVAEGFDYNNLNKFMGNLFFPPGYSTTVLAIGHQFETYEFEDIRGGVKPFDYILYPFPHGDYYITTK
jgi:hypothetical protein